MLTVMMECRDQEPELAQTLAVLVAGAVEGLVSDVIVLDHGSSDGSSRVADAAGCRFYTIWDLKDVVAAARGEWLLLIEAGARPLSGWVDEIGEYMALNRVPARFSPSRLHRRPFYKRLVHRASVLESGLLLPKKQALSAVGSNMALGELALGHKPKRLVSELVPSWVARQARA